MGDGLSHDEITTLGTYNSERSRGVVHAPEFAKRMAVLQARFDAHMARLDADIERADLELTWLRATAPRHWERVLIAIALVVAVVAAAYGFAEWVMV